MTTLTTAGRQVHADTHDGRRVVAGVDDSPAAANLTEQAFRAAGGVPGDLDLIIETPEGNTGPVLTGIAPGTGDVLVVGSARGHRLGRAVHGSVSAYCARHSRCPVTVVAASRPGHSGGSAPEA
jgi:universal stress protein family protein